MGNSERMILLLSIAASLCFHVRTQQKGEGLNDQCICSDNKTGHYTCCKPVTLTLDEQVRKEYNDTICVKIKNLRSKPGIRFSFYWNGRVLIQHKLRTLNFPPFCVATPRIHSTDVCLKFNNLTISRTRSTGCVDFEVDSRTATNILQCGCFALIRRNKISKNKKSSLLNLLKSKNIKRLKLVSKNRLHWKDFLQKNLGKNLSFVIARRLMRERAALNASARKVSPVVGDKSSLSEVDCWCREYLFVRCECCVPIFGKQEARGCVKLKHLPYHKDLGVIFTVNGRVKINESIPSSITEKLCSHYKLDEDVKVGVCIKPSRRITTHQRKGLCLDIDAHKSKIRFKYRFGCVFLATRNTPLASHLYSVHVGR